MQQGLHSVITNRGTCMHEDGISEVVLIRIGCQAQSERKMEKASFDLPKLAIFVLLIGTVVPIFGEGQLVIEEVIVEEPKMVNGEKEFSVVPPKVVVVKNIMTGRPDECAQNGEICNYFGTGKPVCCEGYTCTPMRPWGFCVEESAQKA